MHNSCCLRFGVCCFHKNGKKITLNGEGKKREVWVFPAKRPTFGKKDYQMSLVNAISWQRLCVYTLRDSSLGGQSSDEPKLEFSGLSRAEPSWGTLIFELKPSWTEIFLTHLFAKFLLSEVLYHDFMIIYLNFCVFKGE